MEALLAVAELRFEDLEGVDNLGALLLLLLEFVDFVHELDYFLFALLEHLL